MTLPNPARRAAVVAAGTTAVVLATSGIALATAGLGTATGGAAPAGLLPSPIASILPSPITSALPTVSPSLVPLPTSSPLPVSVPVPAPTSSLPLTSPTATATAAPHTTVGGPAVLGQRTSAPTTPGPGAQRAGGYASRTLGWAPSAATGAYRLAALDTSAPLTATLAGNTPDLAGPAAAVRAALHRGLGGPGGLPGLLVVLATVTVGAVVAGHVNVLQRRLATSRA